MHLNVASVSKTRNLLIHLFQETEYDIIVLTEHWLTRSEIDAFVIPGFKVVASFCRELKAGGGVLIIISLNLNVSIERRAA